MSRLEKVLERILRGTADANINFEDLLLLLQELGFQERVRGSHHIYSKEGIVEIINLQSRGAKVKPIRSNRFAI